MADLEFEDELRSMFASASATPDTEVFALRVERGLVRMRWVRCAMVAGLGAVGALMAWFMFGVSLVDVSRAFGVMTSAASPDAISDEASAWAAGLLLLALGGLLVRPVFSES